MKNVNEARALPTRWTPKLAEAITSLMKATETVDLKRASVIDTLRSAGIKSTDFISPKSEGSTATPELQAALKAAIVKGFPAAKRKLIEAPKGSLSKDQMARRREHIQSITAYMGAFKRDLYNKEPEGIAKAKAKKEGGRAAQQPIHVVKSDDPVVNESNKINAKICKKIRDLQTYIEDKAPVKSANDTRELLRKALELFSQQH